MAYEMKPGQGSIFRNEKKTTDTHPDYKGSAMLPDGTECWISGWIKRPDGKTPFISLSIQAKELIIDNTAPAPQPVNDLPFQ